MPSVGMIRSTRVFVPKSPSSSSSSSSVRNNNKLGRRFIKEDDAADWFNERVSKGVLNHQYESIMMEFNKETQSTSIEQQEVVEEEIDVKKESVLLSDTEFVENKKRFGSVYSRKRRKLLVTGEGGMEVVVERGVWNEGRMFGKQFVRKKKKERGNLELKELNSSSSLVNKEEELVKIGALEENSLPPPVKESVGGGKTVVLSFLIDTTTTSLSSVYQFLNSILRYMWKKNSRLRLSLLAAFMNDQTISRVFSAHGGIHLLQDSLSSSSSGICRIQRSRNNVPIFCIDFSAIPFSFMRLHFTMSLECQRLPHCVQVFLNGNVGSGKSLKKRKVDEITGGSELCLSSPEKKRSCSRRVNVNPLSTIFYSDILDSDCPFFASSDDWVSPAVSNCEPKQIKRKSALVCHLNTEEADFFMFGNDWTPLVLEPKHKKRKLSSEHPTYDPNSQLEGATVDSENGIDLSSCTANVLVLESDKCYRKEGARVMLEYSSSKEWVLVIKEKDLVLYSYKATHLTWTFKTNRFTLAMIWTGLDGWNLEFPDRGDWSIFKQLHKECIHRNSKAALAKTIPVPTVREVPALAKPIPIPIFREVPDYVNCDYVPFVQPGAYITLEDNKFVTYDADSGDEEWLGKLGNDCYGENSLSLEKFEEIIDSFEKATFYSLNNKIDESRAIALCSDSERNLVVDVYKYWLKKRKRKRSSPLKVFQARPPKKVQSALSKPVLRKRRSIKKKNEHCGRGARKLFFQEFDPEFDPVKEKVEEARRIKREKEDEARRIKKEKEPVAQEEKVRKAREDSLSKTENADILRVDQAAKAARDKMESENADILRVEQAAKAAREKLESENADILVVEQATKAAREKLESENADILRVEQATKAASEKLELALRKRQRAQTLMEYADLAAEWATMAMKIAQATRISGSSEVAAASCLDD
ncbi:hypothetical protein MKX01_030079 [Papaver californicum]|nr:hypothetical protein MKX01_030079 [Papaver californicum]